MEQEPPAPDRRVVRAARSLYINRRNREIVEGRIERATATLTSYLGLYGLAVARCGFFDVELTDGDIRLKKLPSPDAAQPVGWTSLRAPHRWLWAGRLGLRLRCSQGAARDRPSLAGRVARLKQ